MFSTGDASDLGAFYGQVAVSLSTIESVRQKVIDNHLDKFLPLCGALNPNRQSRVVALSFLRNLAVDTRELCTRYFCVIYWLNFRAS